MHATRCAGADLPIRLSAIMIDLTIMMTRTHDAFSVTPTGRFRAAAAAAATGIIMMVTRARKIPRLVPLAAGAV